MTPMLCATRSCSSRAIRPRSSATAWAARAALSRSAAATPGRQRSRLVAGGRRIQRPKRPDPSHDEPGREHVVDAVRRPPAAGRRRRARRPPTTAAPAAATRQVCVRRHRVEGEQQREPGLEDVAAELVLHPGGDRHQHQHGERPAPPHQQRDSDAGASRAACSSRPPCQAPAAVVPHTETCPDTASTRPTRTSAACFSCRDDMGGTVATGPGPTESVLEEEPMGRVRLDEGAQRSAAGRTTRNGRRSLASSCPRRPSKEC